jgi:hypothetical protein
MGFLNQQMAIGPKIPGRTKVQARQWSSRKQASWQSRGRGRGMASEA